MFIILIFAFLSGIVTVLSPCILPVLPLLLSAGLDQGKYRPHGIILGLILSFTFFTLSLTALVHATGVSPDVLRYVSLVLISLFGLTLIFPPLEHAFARLTAPIAQLGNKLQSFDHTSTGFISGCVLGIALGLVWAPCAGPILATITTLVATGSVTFKAFIITLSYSLGTALPMFLIMQGGNTLVTSIGAITPYLGIVRKLFGFLMIMSALAIGLHFDVKLQQFTLKYFPTLKVENNKALLQELDTLQNNGPADSAPTVGRIAPDLKNIVAWINSPELTLNNLKGKVVLLDFWTYSCINCVRTLPYLKKWYDTYKDKGLVIIGVHTPEFEFEKSVSNVQDAVNRFDIQYPVALDSYYATWKNYHNHYWPAHYLIDQQGVLHSMHFGEGGYVSTENNIRTLLGLDPILEKEQSSNPQALSPEIYLGTLRASNYTYESRVVPGNTRMFQLTIPPTLNHVGLQGIWYAAPESITSKSDDAQLTLNFTAAQVYLVMSANQKSKVSLQLDNKPIPPKNYTNDMNDKGIIYVDAARMYHLLNLNGASGNHVLTISLPNGVSLYAFTFGK